MLRTAILRSSSVLFIVLLIVSAASLAFAQSGQCGDFAWAEEGVGLERDEGHGVAVDPFGNVFFGGWFDSDTIDFGAAAGVNAIQGQSGNGDIFITRFKPDGTLSWVTSAGGNNSDWCWDIAAGPDGSVFATGEFYSTTMDFGDGITISKSGLSDAWVAKWDSTGAIQWANSFGAGDSDQAFGVDVDNAGHCYITGAFGQTIAHGSTTLVETGGGDDLFVAVYDPMGNPTWAVSTGGPAYDAGQDIAVGDDGRIYVAGRSFGDMNFAGTSWLNKGLGDMFLLAYQPGGVEDWMFITGGADGDEAHGVAVHPQDGSVILAGSFWSSPISFAGALLGSSGQWDAFVSRFDANGNLMWVRGTGGTASDRFYGVDISPQGLIFAGGQWGSSGNLYGIPMIGPGILTSVWDANGRALKAKTYTGLLSQFDIVWDVAAGPDGNGYFGGELTGATIDFGGGVTVTNGPGGGFDSDLFIAAEGPNLLQQPANLSSNLTTALDLNWDPVAQADKYRIKIKRVNPAPKKKKLFVSSTNSFSISGFAFPAGDHYQWAVRAACVTDTSDWSSPADIFIPQNRAASAIASPNPAKTATVISAKLNGAYTLSVVDLAGRIVFQGSGESDGKLEIPLDTRDWPRGLYLFSLSTETQTLSGQVSIE